ncbi:hypothetical protein SLA2020_018640 [Shorea laevis]
MLAKQAWRLMQNPQSLWVRVLKSLYFKETSFLSARKGSHPSWAWTSILKGREILHLGSRWNVGDGREILIYEDAWVPTLPQFKLLDESIMHALLYCPHVEPIWFGSALGFIPGQLRLQNFVEWWRFLVVNQKQMGTRLLIEQWAIICWTIWKARNKHYFEHNNFNPAQVINQSHGMFREYCLTPNRDLLTPPVCTTQRKQVISRWTSPLPGFIKINVDASYLYNSGRTILAMVGRDPNGQIVMGRTWLCLALSPLMAEATALLKAIQTADDLGLEHVIFESDNEALITYAQQANKPSPWEITSIMHIIRSTCNLKSSYLFSFVPRGGNRVADWVARSTLNGQCPYYWAHCPPNILLQLLSEDNTCNPGS